MGSGEQKFSKIFLFAYIINEKLPMIGRWSRVLMRLCPHWKVSQEKKCWKIFHAVLFQ
jgi:hypothetical protein